MPLSRHVELFTDFANSHLNGDPDNDYHIRLKLDHSLRVLENAQAIISGEGLTGRTASLSSLAALYHDIGRFPQFAEYATFKDTDSVNHGRLGLLTLRTLDLPKTISDNDWRLVRAAVGLHNVKHVNPQTQSLLADMVNITRDADKIDIYGVILAHLNEKNDPNRVVIHSLEEHPTKYSASVFETVFTEKMCDYNLLRYTNDFVLLLIGWLFALNFKTSVKLISQRGLIKHAFSFLPKTDEIKQLEAKTITFMRYKNCE